MTNVATYPLFCFDLGPLQFLRVVSVESTHTQSEDLKHDYIIFRNDLGVVALLHILEPVIAA